MKTATLRFVTVRNPEPAPPIVCTFPFNPSVLTAEADYNRSLFKKLDAVHKNTALKPAEKVKEIRDTVAAFKSSISFISDDQQFQSLYPGFVEFRDWIISRRKVTVKEIHRQAEKALHFSARRTLTAKELLNLTDNLIAHIISNDDPRLRDQISFALRINNIVKKAGLVRGATDLRKLISAPVILPDVVFLPIPKQERPAMTESREDAALAKRKRNWERLNQLSTAHEELAEARSVQIQPPVKPASEVGPVGRNVEKSPTEPPAPPQNDFTSSNLRKEHLASFSPPTREVLNELRITEDTKFVDASSKIARKAQEVATQIGQSISPYTERVMIGNTLVRREDIRSGELEPRPERDGPQEHMNGECEFRFPFKIADLRIVEQELKDYLAGEVAHVENILQGELKERSTRRLKRTEETLFTSAEREETNERDTQTTNRYQLEQEISETVKQDSEMEVNGKVDTKYYGPVIVEASVSAGYSTSNSTEQSTREAVSYAKDVVERSAQKIIEKVTEERTRKTTEEFEEGNRHILNNVGGQHHVVGVYRWLNKDYKVWLKNYGKRMMFELMIPEPAAYHIYAMTQKKDNSTGDLKEPTSPKDPEYAKELGVPGFALSSHKSITEFNYPIWAAAYGADVTPPPPPFLTIATVLVKTSDDTVQYAQSAASALTVPPGYIAKTCSVILDYHNGPIGGKGGWGVAMIGLRAFGTNHYGVSMYGETGTIPITLHGYNQRLVAHYEVTCEPLPETIEAWKITTYQAIIDAYEAKKAAYQNAVAEALAGAGVVIRGTNPLFNKTIIQTELKKNAIRLMAHCHPLFSSAMTDEPGGFDCCQVMKESPYIKFVEQVFEWRNMVYEFYPYHWAKKTHWTDLYNLSDTDPLFQNFLKAGYARILVPVTPGYNNAATNFVTLGTPDLNDLASMQVMDIINGMDEDAPTLAAVRVSTQADIDLANPGATIDGITKVAGDRVLVRHQTIDAENGVYVWNGSAVAMTRATDADTPIELAQAVIEVKEGTDAGFMFRQTELPLNTIGVDSIVFQIAAEVINESLLIPTDLTILECKSAGVEPTTMKILGLCETAGTMVPVLGGATQTEGNEEDEEEDEDEDDDTGNGHSHGDSHEHEQGTQ
ncbi:MAG TPA: hypothetical protein VJU86_00390 [Pyrinomonadaceae bacterium]|nr:hypothetical protein [Pyrinomonadaceae bacterium]